MGKRQWGGCITQSDFLSLVKAGAQARPYEITWAERDIAAGKSKANWRYFTAKPGSELETLLHEIHPGTHAKQ